MDKYIVNRISETEDVKKELFKKLGNALQSENVDEVFSLSVRLFNNEERLRELKVLKYGRIYG